MAVIIWRGSWFNTASKLLLCDPLLFCLFWVAWGRFIFIVLRTVQFLVVGSPVVINLLTLLLTHHEQIFSYPWLKVANHKVIVFGLIFGRKEANKKQLFRLRFLPQWSEIQGWKVFPKWWIIDTVKSNWDKSIVNNSLKDLRKQMKHNNTVFQQLNLL